MLKIKQIHGKKLGDLERGCCFKHSGTIFQLCRSGLKVSLTDEYLLVYNLESALVEAIHENKIVTLLDGELTVSEQIDA